MFSFLHKKSAEPSTKNTGDFDYLQPNTFYFDTACQTLRPQQVIDSEIDYYHNFNSCGHRVKYKWGEQTDRLVAQCRQNLLKLTGKSDKEYTVAFCLNTTHGINTVLHQIDPQKLDLKQIVTSQIEHNSVFLSSLTFANRHNLPRLILERNGDLPKNSGNSNQNDPGGGSLIYDHNQLQKSIVIVNTQSNIDGRELLNAEQLAKDTHEGGGILLLDACQTFGHNPEMLKDVDFDAVFGSGHKMYGPSVGFIIIKKDLLKKLDCFLIGGSTVQDVKLNSFELIENDEEIYARIEPGLQNYAGIIGLNEAVKWREKFVKNKESSQKETPLWRGGVEGDGVGLSSKNLFQAPFQNQNYEHHLSLYLNQRLRQIADIQLLNPNPSPVVSLYSDKMDGHKMAMYLSETGIMCRSGYHCCHYYLKEKLNLPPLLRISLGLNNTPEQIDYLIKKLQVILG